MSEEAQGAPEPGKAGGWEAASEHPSEQSGVVSEEAQGAPEPVEAGGREAASEHPSEQSGVVSEEAQGAPEPVEAGGWEAASEHPSEQSDAVSVNTGVTDAAPAERPYLAWLAAGTTVLMWASAFVGIRAVGETYDPGALALGRLLIGALALGVIVVIRGARLPRGRRELSLVVVYGVLWFAAYNVALNAGERHLDAGTAALLINVGPVLLALSAGLFLGEGFPRQLLVGGAIAFAGVAVISFGASGTHRVDGVGVVLCLAAAACYAAAVTVQKPVLRTVGALPATWLGCVVGAIACVPFVPGLWEQTAGASVGTIAGLVYLGVGPTAVAFTTWAYALARTDAGKMGATTYLVPALVIVMSAIVLGELPPTLAFAGGALCLVGVAVTRLRPRTPRR